MGVCSDNDEISLDYLFFSMSPYVTVLFKGPNGERMSSSPLCDAATTQINFASLLLQQI